MPRDYAEYADLYVRHLYALRHQRGLNLITAMSVIEFANAALLVGFYHSQYNGVHVVAIFVAASVVLTALALAIAVKLLVPYNVKTETRLHPRYLGKFEDEFELRQEASQVTPARLTVEILNETRLVSRVINEEDALMTWAIPLIVAGVAFLALSALLVASGVPG